MVSEEKTADSCQEYFLVKGVSSPVEISRNLFDEMCETTSFSDGPFQEAFGDGVGEPYNPRRQGFGILKDGRGVFCELSEAPDDEN